MLKLLVYLYMAQFKATLDFIHPSFGGKYVANRVYELDETLEGNDVLVRIGYLQRVSIPVSVVTEVNDGISEMKFRKEEPKKLATDKVKPTIIEEKEEKVVKKTKEFKGNKKTK